MRAYLMQHGKSESAEQDPSRNLTDEGREDVRQVAQFLREQRISVSLIQHSGKARAEETAHILAGNLRVASGPSHTDGLNPLDDPSTTANFLKVYTDDILIVGHLPHLERLTSLLLTGDSNRRPVQFQNAGVVCLDKNADGTWSVLWAVVPELLHKQRLAA